MGAVGTEPLGWAGQFDTGTIFDVCPGGGEGQLGGAIREKRKKAKRSVFGAEPLLVRGTRLTLPGGSTGLHYPSRRVRRLPETRAVIRGKKGNPK